MSIQVVNIGEKLGAFSDHWNPRVIGALNGQQVKVAKLKGEFVMHHHEQEDELFLVMSGELLMELETEVLTIRPGEFVIIPKGVSHKPIAREEVQILLFEPKTTLNTGNTKNDFTKNELDHI